MAAMPENGPAGQISATQSQTPSAKPLIYACSGCSDAGELADQIARRLSRSGFGEMSCLAGIGGRVKSILNKGQKAEPIFVIDGCPLNCARKTLELAGFRNFKHLGLHEIGLRQGSSPVTEENVSAGVAAAKQVLMPATAVEETSQSLISVKPSFPPLV